MATEEADVLVVGGGPVGLTMATERSYRGIKNILVERKTTTSVVTKALLVNARTMEHFRRLGLQKNIEEASYPRDLKVQVSLCTSATGSTICSKSFPSWGEFTDGVPGATFPFTQVGASISTPMFCPQFALEPILKSHLDTCANIKMFWGGMSPQ